MLSEQMWINYANDLIIDYIQSKDEGKDVEKYKQECEAVSKMPKGKKRDMLADGLYHKLKEAPLIEGFKYYEPSSLEEIKSARPKTQIKLNSVPNEGVLYDKIYGAWLGRVSGCLLGKPIEGWRIAEINTLLKETDNYPLKRYISSDISIQIKSKLKMAEDRAWINKINCAAPIDDDTNYTILALKILEKYARSFSNCDVAEAWLSYMPYLSACTAERVAYKNLACAMLPPKSAVYKNPYREWIGAQIRADFYGYINPAEPERAAEMAFYDSSISHTKNGIYGAMYVAAMLSAAATEDDTAKIIHIALSQIPENCRLSEGVKTVLSWHSNKLTADEAVGKIHQIYDEYNPHHWCHTISNAMIVTLGLLYGDGDFEKSICLTVQSGFDTDCNGATVGSITGMINGAKSLPERWTLPFNDTLLTSIGGYEKVKISDIAKKTLKFIK